MKQSLEQVKGILLRWHLAIIALAIVCILNALVLHLLHLQTHQQAMKVVKQVAMLDPAERTDFTIQQLATEYGFEYVLQPSATTPPTELEVFSFANVSLPLKHPSTLQQHAHIILLFNLLFIGLLVFCYRWWLVYQVRPKPFTREKAKPPLNMLPSKEQTKEQSKGKYDVFILLNLQHTLDPNLDAQQHFSVLFGKHFDHDCKCSVKYLKSGALAVTFKTVDWSNITSLGKRVHEVVFQALQLMRADLSRKVVKLGGCYYSDGSDQTQVYQLARSALSVASSNSWQHVHILPLNKTQSMTLQSTEDDFIKYIESGQFVLFFQPLFCFASQEIAQSEALLRVRHKELGLIAAKQFVPQLHSKRNLWTLDTSIILHTLNVLKKDQGNLVASINVHILNWCDTDFSSWLTGQLKQSGLTNRLLFEMTFNDFFQHQHELRSILDELCILNCGVVLDQVSAPLTVKELKLFPCIKAVKLSFELVHHIDSAPQQQKIVQQIVRQGRRLRLPVYAVGVETQAELLCLQKLGVQGAQGYYFSEPLQQIELAGY